MGEAMIERLSQMLGEENSGIYPHKTEEKYPRIVDKIAVLWGTSGMSKYFTELLFDDRGGRAGFPSEVMMEIFRLSNFHESSKPSRGKLETAWENPELTRFDRLGGETKG